MTTEGAAGAAELASASMAVAAAASDSGGGIAAAAATAKGAGAGGAGGGRKVDALVEQLRGSSAVQLRLLEEVGAVRRHIEGTDGAAAEACAALQGTLGPLMADVQGKHLIIQRLLEELEDKSALVATLRRRLEEEERRGCLRERALTRDVGGVSEEEMAGMEKEVLVARVVETQRAAAANYRAAEELKEKLFEAGNEVVRVKERQRAVETLKGGLVEQSARIVQLQGEVKKGEARCRRAMEVAAQQESVIEKMEAAAAAAAAQQQQEEGSAGIDGAGGGQRQVVAALKLQLAAAKRKEAEQRVVIEGCRSGGEAAARQQQQQQSDDRHRRLVAALRAELDGLGRSLGCTAAAAALRPRTLSFVAGRSSSSSEDDDDDGEAEVVADVARLRAAATRSRAALIEVCGVLRRLRLCEEEDGAAEAAAAAAAAAAAEGEEPAEGGGELRASALADLAFLSEVAPAVRAACADVVGFLGIGGAGGGGGGGGGGVLSLPRTAVGAARAVAERVRVVLCDGEGGGGGGGDGDGCVLDGVRAFHSEVVAAAAEDEEEEDEEGPAAAAAAATTTLLHGSLSEARDAWGRLRTRARNAEALVDRFTEDAATAGAAGGDADALSERRRADALEVRVGVLGEAAALRERKAAAEVAKLKVLLAEARAQAMAAKPPSPVPSVPQQQQRKGSLGRVKKLDPIVPRHRFQDK